MTKNKSSLVVGKTVLTMNEERQIINDAAIKVTNGRIAEIGKREEILKKNSDLVIHGGDNFLLIPGLINAHQHLTGDRLIRSCIPDSITDNEAIFDWAIPIHEAHTSEDDEISATLVLAESARNGITFTVEAGTVAHPGSVLKGFENIGVGGTLGSWGWDVGDGPYSGKTVDDVLIRQLDVLELTKEHPSVKGWVTLVGHDLMSDDLLKKASELAIENSTNLTFHLSPNLSDVESYLERTGVRPVLHLKDLGVLGEHLLIAHAVHLDDQELETLINTKTAIASCPWAYLRLGQGVTKLGRHPEFFSRGGSLSLGCDAGNAGDNVDILSSAKLFAGLIQESEIEGMSSASISALELATIEGAKAIGLSNEIGSIEIGKRADIVFIDLEDQAWKPQSPDPVKQLIWSAGTSGIHSVMALGEMVVVEGTCLKIDEEEKFSDLQERQQRLLGDAGLEPRPHWPTV
ncbi:MAG: amidohydrolase family protein [Actinomycetota bacterium]|nr:amidohydrolase family protein [Actinomycetota bacterium]